METRGLRGFPAQRGLAQPQPLPEVEGILVDDSGDGRFRKLISRFGEFVEVSGEMRRCESCKEERKTDSLAMSQRCLVQSL